MGRIMFHGQARLHAWIDRIVLVLYHRLPLPLKAKTRLRNFLFKNIPFLFRKTNGYWRWLQTERYLSNRQRYSNPRTWGILATPDMAHIVHPIERRLQEHGWQVTLLTEPPEQFLHDLYFVIYPNKLEILPRGKKLVVFHTEPVTDSLLSSDEYIAILRKSVGVLESSICGMKALEKRGIRYPLVHYLPIQDWDHSGTNKYPEDRIEDWEERFTFMLDRFLIATDLLSENHAYGMPVLLRPPSDRIAVSMPERFDRRFSFHKNIKALDIDIGIFDGIRHQPGWIGNALSQSILARYALKNDMEHFTIMEDDVVFPKNFHNRLSVVHEFLESLSGEWDIFSGVMTHLSQDTEISRITEFKGQIFIILDQLNSTVFNIYSRSGLRILASWHPDRVSNDNCNIDQFLRRHNNLRVVTTYPFLVNHEIDGTSTMYQHSNEVYSDAISRTEERFGQIVHSSR